MAFIFSFQSDDDMAWRSMISFGAVISLLLFVGVCIMPESPRWLVEKNKLAQARHVLRRISECKDPDNMDSDIEHKIKGRPTAIYLTMFLA